MDRVACSSDEAGRVVSGPLLTPDEVAQILRVSRARVYELARRRMIGGVVRVGRQVRFSRDGFESWLAAGGEPLDGGWRLGTPSEGGA
ncbi:MAG: helix-turn-helix domain-containing protein [Myxococcota bacterium]